MTTDQLPQPGDEILAISLYEPWASLMRLGEKHVETRDWPTRYRGWVAIHTSKNFDRVSQEMCTREPFLQVLTAAGLLRGVSGLLAGFVTLDQHFTFGAVIAVARLSGCYRSTDPHIARLLADRPREAAFGNYDPGRWCHVYDRVVPLATPISARGARMFWKWRVPAEVAYASD